MSYTFSNSPTPDAPLSATSTESDNSAYSVRSSMNNTDSQVQDGPKLPNGTPWNTMNNGFNPNQPHHFQQRQFSQGVAQHQSQLIPPSHPGAMPNMRHVQGANPLIMQQQQQQRPPQMAQQNLPQNVADLQNLQNKTLAQNYNQMQQRLMAQHQQQQLFGGAAGGPMAGLTPYQQQQAMIQIQQQQQQHQAQQQLQQQQQQIMAAQRQMQQAQQAQQHLQQQHQQAMNGLGQQIGRPPTAMSAQAHQQPPQHHQQHHGMAINPQMMFNAQSQQPQPIAQPSAASPPAASSTPAPQITVPPSPALSTSSLARGGGGGLQRAQSTSGLGMGVGSPAVGASGAAQLPQQMLTPQHSGMDGARGGSMGPWQNGVDGRAGSRPPQGPPMPPQRQNTAPTAAPIQQQLTGGGGVPGSQIHGTPRMGNMGPPAGMTGMPNGAPVGLGVAGMMQNGNNGMVMSQQPQQQMPQMQGSAPLAPPQTPQQQRISHPPGVIPTPQTQPQPQQRPPGLPPNVQMPSMQQIVNSLPPGHQKALMALPPQKQKEQLMHLQQQWIRQMQAQAAREGEMGPPKGVNVPVGGLQTPRQSSTIIPPPPPGTTTTANAVVPPSTPTSATGSAPVPVPPIAHGTGIGSVLPPHIQAKLDPRTTQISPLPLLSSPTDLTHGGALPELSEKEMDEIVAWMAKDKKYLSVVDDEERRKRIGKEVQEGVIGRPKWWENEPGGMVISGGAKFDVVWPSHRRKLREERRGRKEVRFPMEYKLEQSATPEVLVPVRIDLEFEHYRLRDTFVWNMHDPVVTPEQFALATCQDFDLPLSAAPLIGKSIQEQLQEFKSLTHPTAGRGDNEEHAGWMEEEDDEWGWWEGWRKKLKLGEAGEYVGVNPIIEEPPVLPVEPTKPAVTEDASQEVKMETEGEVKQEEVEVIDVDKTPEEKLQVPERAVTPHEELRILIKLDILVGSKHLVDQFEWDTNDPLNSPEVFAEIYASDLGLGGEFKTAIAHDIREQIHMYQRSLVVIGHRFDGSVIQDEELRTALLPPVTPANAARSTDGAASNMPILNALSDGEIENNEKEREKDLKRKKRQARGRRGVVLPDREPVKTNRTLIGTADISASMPPPALATVPSRRAAAVTATQTIATLVAQENNNGYVMTPGLGGSVPLSHAGTPTRDVSNPPPSSQQAGRSSKRQKTGHLLRAPDVPESVLGKRAQLGASTATSSTGVEPPPKPPGYVRPGEEEDSDSGKPKLVGWHCSTCGCPDAIAIGRRKGPKGDKSQCGPCGKYYHRYRRIKDVEFNPDPEYHLKLREEEEDRKKRKRPAKKAVVVNEEPSASATPANDAPSPTGVKEDDEEDDDEDDGPPLAQALINAQPSPRPRSPATRIRSPDTSPSPPPLASTRLPASRSPAAKGRPSTPPPPPSNNPVTPPSSLAPPQPHRNREAPEWMTRCIEEMQVKYENDRFGAILRPLQPGMPADGPREWRIKCFDCPGKVYTPGPEETLTNFEVHLKNKRHRDNVNARLARERGSAS